LSSYLADRRQVLVVGGAPSGELPVTHGVPQGSTLGPLLFILLVNDFAGGDEALMYADDITLIRSGATVGIVEEAIEEDLVLAEGWFTRNKLQLNINKTQKLVCSLGRTLSVISAQHVRLLGFTLDGRLSWQFHIDDVCEKLSRVIFLLRRLNSSLSESYLITFYHSLFHSHLIYGILLWGHAPACDF
jgi:ribonuclease P/MRP protein subunit RPP40